MTETTHEPHPDRSAADLENAQAVIPPADRAGEAESIIDTVMGLNAFLAADVRRPSAVTHFCIRPELAARKDELLQALAPHLDERGRIVADDEAAATERGPHLIAAELADIQDQIDASKWYVRITKMSPAAWDNFRDTHKDQLELNEWTNEMRRAILAESQVEARPFPKPGHADTGRYESWPIPPERYDLLRERFGDPVVFDFAQTAWQANSTVGVDVPKSLLSSLAQGRKVPGPN